MRALILFFVFVFSLSLFQTASALTNPNKLVKLTFSASPLQIQEGQTTRLTWLTEKGEDIICIAGGGWTGNKTGTGIGIETLSPKVTLTYTLACRGSNSVATTTKTVVVEVAKTNPSPVRAFPGAEGFGAYTPGGRGGRVIEVTNLNDSGPGSFRDAVQASNPRIVVFRVAGTIDICPAGGGPIWLNNPFITVAGQTAPGGGITLRLNPTCNIPNPTVLGINTNDVVIRHIRIRAGKQTATINTGAAINFAQNAYNVVLDHLSLSWSTDQLLGVSRGARDITIQWSIFSEALRNTFTGDAYGMLISDDEGFLGTGNISVHHNLFAHNHHRHPQVTISGVVDLVNNVIYNFIEEGARIWTVGNKPASVNIINNYIKAGPSTEKPTQEIIVRHHNSILNAPPLVYVQGNIGPKRPSDNLPHADSITCIKDSQPCANDTYVSPTRFNTPPITTTGAAAAFSSVLQGAGTRATITNGRDSVDVRIISQVQNTTGGAIENPLEVGGWPTIAPATPLPDFDKDGMPDAWELANGFNPTDITDGSTDVDGDIYTNVEEFLNGTNPRVAQAVELPPIAYQAPEQTAQIVDADAHLRTGIILLVSMVVLLTGVFTYKRFAKQK